MSRRLELTWDKKRGRWKKCYRGRQYYVGSGTGKGDAAGYQNALTSWREKKQELDAAELAAQKTEDDGFVATVPSFGGMSIEAMRRAIERYEVQYEGKTPATNVTTAIKTVGQVLEQFSKTFEAKAAAGQLAQSNVVVLLVNIKTVGKLIGEGKPVTVMAAGETYLSVHTALMDELAKGAKGDRYVQTLMHLAKRFGRWCAACGFIESVPDVLLTKSRDLSFRIKPKEIITFDLVQVETLLAKASDRTRLFILLALNVGMTQVDISDLAPREVDWKLGTITRKRSKEKDEENVPTVCWKLWPTTLELLKRFGRRDGDRVLVNENGTPLRQVCVKTKKNIDNVRSSFERLLHKLKKDRPAGKTFKHLRKTASTQLKKSREGFGQYAQYFLCHAPDNQADSAYVVPDPEQFDDAVAWLGREFRQFA